MAGCAIRLGPRPPLAGISSCYIPGLYSDQAVGIRVLAFMESSETRLASCIAPGYSSHGASAQIPALQVSAHRISGDSGISSRVVSNRVCGGRGVLYSHNANLFEPVITNTDVL